MRISKLTIDNVGVTVDSVLRINIGLLSHIFLPELGVVLDAVVNTTIEVLSVDCGGGRH